MKLSYERIFCRSRTWKDILPKQIHERMFCWGKHIRRQVMLEKYKYIPADRAWCSCISLPCKALLVSLLFACCDFIERKAPKNFLWYSGCFLLLPQTCANSARISCFLPELCHCYWFMYSYLEPPPKNYFQTGPHSPFPLHHLSPLSLISKLEEGWKHLITHINVGFEKSKWTNNLKPNSSGSTPW